MFRFSIRFTGFNHMIAYHIIWYHIIWFDIISYHNIRSHIIWYHMIWYLMIWYNMILYHYDDVWLKLFHFYFENNRPCWGYDWLSWLVILSLSKKWKIFCYFFLKSFIDIWAINFYHHWLLLARKNIFFKISKSIFRNMFSANLF